MRGVIRLVPRHIKRLVFWTAVYAKLRGTRELKDSEAQQLNQQMDLSVSTSALQAPAILSPVIWPDVSLCCELAAEVRQADHEASVVSRFVDSVPNWVRYASPEKIQADLKEFLQCDLIAFPA